jgi:hypothetical protein
MQYLQPVKSERWGSNHQSINPRIYMLASEPCDGTVLPKNEHQWPTEADTQMDAKPPN